MFANRLLWEKSSSDHKHASFVRTLELYQQYGLDGYATFAWPGTGEYDRTLKTVYDTASQMNLDPDAFSIMLEIAPFPDYLNMNEKTLEMIASNPYSFRVNGKSLISSYILDHLSPEKMGEHIQRFREQADGKVAILPMVHFLRLEDGNGRRVSASALHQMYLDHGTLPASLVKKMQAYLREYARVSDGLYIGPVQSLPDYTFDETFADEVIYPLFASVLAEPEFNGKKLFGSQIKVGYTSYHGSQNLSRDGTKTLRKNLELAARYKPDVIIGTEWDELNEDTGFQPLVAKPMASQRIMKYYTSLFRSQSPAPNADDDTSLPNLIISQRRQLMLGEALHIELLNVPDTTQGEPYTVQLNLLDEKGDPLHASSPIAFDTASLKDHTIVLPSEDFPNARVIRAHLTIKYRGSESVIATGLPFTVLKVTTAWDQTYFNTPLRNVAQPVKANITFERKKQIASDVTQVALSAAIETAEEISAIEVVQDSREIFAYDAHDEYLTSDPSRQLYTLTWQYINQPSRINVAFEVDLKEAPSAKTFTRPLSESMPKTTVPNVKAEAAAAFTESNHSGWAKNRFSGFASWWDGKRSFSIHRDDIPNAVVTVTGQRTSGKNKGQPFEWTLPLAELGAYGIVSHVFEDGLMLALETQHRPLDQPLPVGEKRVTFEDDIMADEPDGTLALRIVTTDGKVYWSDPFIVNEQASADRLPIHVYSDLQKKHVSLDVASSRVPDIQYEFSPRMGNILHTSVGRGYYAHAGGYLSTAIAFAGHENSMYSLPFRLYQNDIFAGADKPAPDWVELPDEQGQWALKFDGQRGNFLVMPNVVIPQRAGYTLSFDIKPEEVKPSQMIFGNMGVHQGSVELSVKDGHFNIRYFRRTPGNPDLPWWSFRDFKTSIPLHEDQWQKVIFAYDGRKITLKANGREESFPFEGIALYLQPSSFGGRGKRTSDDVIPFYDGLLRSLRVEHHVPADGR